MWLQIFWTEEDERHIARHGVSPEEAEEALRSRRFLRRTGDRYLLIGKAGSRTLVIVLEPTSPTAHTARVVTARAPGFPRKGYYAGVGS